MTFAILAANRITKALRLNLFKSLLRQDAAFHSSIPPGKLAHLVSSDISLIHAGIGDKLATAAQSFSTFFVAVAVAFAFSWKLTLITLACTPLLLLSGMISGRATADANADGLGAYANAGGIATEVLSLIRTVTAFGGQEQEAVRYEKSLSEAYGASIKAALAQGLGLGIGMLLIMWTYGLAFWIGGNLARNGEITAGDILTTFFALTLGANQLGTASPAFKSFSVARAAAPRVFEIIDRRSPLDALDDEHGLIPDQPVNGHISFHGVDFVYPSKGTEHGSNSLVLQDFDLDIPAGSSQALVGKSGSGKSTAAALIQRFYDPLNGSVKLDGVDIRELNVRWLRSQIGVVAQTPSLFMLSIRDNIKLGAGVDFVKDPHTGKPTAVRREVTDEEVIAAAKLANAHDFITKLPEGYETMLGERGAMLSGGQKQRVCIARALVRDPKILILDESTASLDTVSEKLVQKALENASRGRCTVTIAHRLSTIRNSDSIACIEKGRVIESGPHEKLMTIDGGFYKDLIELQTVERERMEQEKELEGKDSSDEGMPIETPDVASVSVTKTGADSVSVRLPGEDEDAKEKLPDVDKGVFKRALKLNSPESFLLIFGVFGAVVAGSVWPLAAIGVTKIIEILLLDNDPADVRFWALGFVILGLMGIFGNFMQHGVLGVTGEKLVRRVRTLSFRSLLRQDMGYFDLEGNSVGALAGRLSRDAGSVRGLTGDLFGTGANVVSSLVTALIISFVSCWRISLVVIAIIPGIMLGGFLTMQASAGLDSGSRSDFDKSNSVAAEAVENIGTVRSLGVEDHFSNRYNSLIGDTGKSSVRKALITGIGFGFSEFCLYLIWFATFKAGADFVGKGFCGFSDMLVAMMSILFGSFMLGSVAVFAPDIGASKLGATHVFRLLDRVSAVDPTSDDGHKEGNVVGDVKAEKVYFEYPRRPDVPVLRGLSLDVEHGNTLAIVGSSGHGKSTIIGLLERFYNVRAGNISVDGRDVTETNVKYLRRHIGLVSQEPDLFDRTVFENIAYGAPNEDGTPLSLEDVVEAAKAANAHDFISALPQGYDTKVGTRGESLSGGQRQRVAIARSLIRKPEVLLLDEATSALDAESEHVVQAALDAASAGRTTLVVAHRLSTIKNADCIVVVRKGRVVESGTHDSLLNKNGYYAQLVEHQLTSV